MKRMQILPVLLLSVAASAAQAQTEVYYPVLRGFYPVAAQIGATSELEVIASNDLRGASRVLVSGDGVQGEIIPPQPVENAKPDEKPAPLLRHKIRFTVAAEALPGPRQVRLLTPRGGSTLAEIVLVRDPVVVEAADNNTPAKAQAINSLPTVVCGQIEAKEDSDCFRFHLDGPQSLVFHVWGQRLLHPLMDLRGRRFDALLTLRSAAGAVLAMSDNVLEDDPLLAYAFTAAGDYVLEIRDVRYHGWAEYWPYAIEINSRPFVTQPGKLVVTPTAETRLPLVGFNIPPAADALLTIPADAPDGLRLVSPLVAGQPANGFHIVVSRLPQAAEIAGDNDAVEAAQPISVPSIISGCIEQPGDADCFRFEAQAGDKFSFDCVARRAGSPLDPILRILDAKGATLTEIDDAKYSLFTLADPELESWTAPSDGVYSLEVRDAVAAGGPQFVYALSVVRSQPRFLLEVNTDKTLLAPGTRAPFFVRVERRNGFAGAVQLAVEGLPPGVTAECGLIQPTGADGCVILQAAADAPASMANLRITGVAEHVQPDGSKLALTAVARPLSEVHQDGGGRGLVPVQMHTVAVADPLEIRGMNLSAAEIMLPPGTSQRIDITIERAAGFKGNVTLDALFQHLGIFADPLPKGVTIDAAASKGILAGEETTGHLTLKAAADAPPVDKHLIPIMAQVAVNFALRNTYCQPLRVTVPAAAK